MRGDAQLPCQNLPVPACLVEHIYKVRVLKDVLDLPAGKQVLDVLCDAGGNPAPFPKAFPDFNGIGGGLVLFEQKVHLVNVVTGGLVGGAVDGDAVPHLVLHHQHTDFFQLLA